MKIFSKEKVIILAGIFILNVSMVTNVCFAKINNSFIDQLKNKSEQYLAEKNFTKFLDYLSIARVDKTDPEELFFIDYYLVVTKSAYLDFLDQNENWDGYYEQLYDFDAEIIESAKKYVNQHNLNGEIVDMQYLAWNAYLREDDRDGAQEAFDKLINIIITLAEQDKNIVKFLDVAQKISDKGSTRQLNKLFSSYRDYLFENNSDTASIERLVKIADQYLEKDKAETAKIIYHQYLKLILAKYSPAESQLALINICEKFRHHGFYKGRDADFAEEIYALLEEKQGSDVFGEVDSFARAYNLNIMASYERANEEYRRFIKTFKKSKLLPEVYTRLAIINLYMLEQIDAAGLFFDKVINEFKSSDYAEFCTYERAMLWHWQKEFDQAKKLYSDLVKKETEYTDLAAERLKEIEAGINNVDRRYAFNPQVNNAEISQIEMTLDSFPDRVFTGTNSQYKATAQDFASGTVQPLFNYEWSGDLGQNKKPDNSTEFFTQFSHSSPNIVSFKALVADSENTIYRDVWVHKVIVGSPSESSVFKTGDNVKFDAAIKPSSVEDKYFNWVWSIWGEEELQKNEKNFSYRFEKPGVYQVTVTATQNEIKAIKQFNFEVIE
ncbi:MAG: PKD domain-containing protein [Candidatus Omnitrophota bacterium]